MKTHTLIMAVKLFGLNIIMLFQLLILKQPDNLLVTHTFNHSLLPYSAVKRDTTFILKKVTPNFYHSIYIEKNKKSPYYTELFNFNLSEEENESINSDYKNSKSKFKKRILFNIQQEWLLLYKYKNKYYLYSPSDWGNVGRKIIADSGLIEWSIEGPVLAKLVEVKKINERKFILMVQDPSLLKTKIVIYIIDRSRKIAVWKYIRKNKVTEYRLCVAREEAANFDLIVNHCNNMKQPEF